MFSQNYEDIMSEKIQYVVWAFLTGAVVVIAAMQDDTAQAKDYMARLQQQQHQVAAK